MVGLQFFDKITSGMRGDKTASLWKIKPEVHLHQWFPRYRPLGGGGITEVGANRYERWKGALLLSQGGR